MRINYRTDGQLSLSDRIAIEAGIGSRLSFRRIADKLGRHPSTIAYEIRMNRTFIRGSYQFDKDCKHVKRCREKHLCNKSSCFYNCKICKEHDCRKRCICYESIACHKFEKPPYVCNTCKLNRLCIKDRFVYSAKFADAMAVRRRSESRQGIRISDEDLKRLDELISRLVKKGQPLTHIYAEHAHEIPVSLRSLYNYIDRGQLTIKNIDLRRKTGYRLRRKSSKEDRARFWADNQACREGRTYDDYEEFMKTTSVMPVEMDTLKGVREKGKRLLTMIFNENSIMLLFLMPNGKADSVKRVFDFLESGLGRDRFTRLFPVILTDNGSEFKRVDDLELSDETTYRTRVFYCDPMASWQKPHIEKNHEYIRYVIRRGKSLDAYEQEDMTLLMNHINSTKRKLLDGNAPYDMVDEDDEDWRALFKLMKMHLIPADEVHLLPDLFALNR